MNFMTMRMLTKNLWKVLWYGYRKFSLCCTAPAFLVFLWVVYWQVNRHNPPSLLSRPDLYTDWRSRSLSYYMDNVGVLIEPSSPPCLTEEGAGALALVSSAPGRQAHRDAVRSSWGRQLATIFVTGLEGSDELIDNYVEAKQHGDMVVFDFKEHPLNQTLKTALMMNWTLTRCPQVQFLLKTEDDVVINPWALQEVVEARSGDKLIGYKHVNSTPIRDPKQKNYLPLWWYPDDVIPQYLAGSGYLISGELLKDILNGARRVPLHNLEDVYFTYNVAKKTLGYELSHEPRFSPYRPRPSWMSIGCAYWDHVALHSLEPYEVNRIWAYLDEIGRRHERGAHVCGFYKTFIRPVYRFIRLIHL